MKIRKILYLKPGENLIIEDVYVIGLRATNQDGTPLNPLNKISILHDNNYLIEDLHFKFLEGIQPFPLYHFIPKNSIIKVISDDSSLDQIFFYVSDIVDLNTIKDKKSYVKGIQPITSIFSFSIKPFAFKKFILKHAMVFYGYSSRGEIIIDYRKKGFINEFKIDKEEIARGSIHYIFDTPDKVNKEWNKEINDLLYISGLIKEENWYPYFAFCFEVK